MVKILVILAGILFALPCVAQESTSQQTLTRTMNQALVSAPDHLQDGGPCCSTVQPSQDDYSDTGGGLIGLYGGGWNVGEGGVYTGMFFAGAGRHPTGPGTMLELGIARTPAKTVDGVFALNYQQLFVTDKHPGDPKKHHEYLFLNGGYTRFFVTGNAADYGGGVIWRIPGSPAEFKEARFEYREYYIAGYGRQKEVRVSWELGGG